MKVQVEFMIGSKRMSRRVGAEHTERADRPACRQASDPSGSQFSEEGRQMTRSNPCHSQSSPARPRKGRRQRLIFTAIGDDYIRPTISARNHVLRSV